MTFPNILTIIYTRRISIGACADRAKTHIACKTMRFDLTLLPGPAIPTTHLGAFARKKKGR